MEVATIQKKEKILFVTSGNGNTQEAGLINNNKKLSYEKRKSYSRRFEGYTLRVGNNIWFEAGKDYSTPAGQWLLDCNGN